MKKVKVKSKLNLRKEQIANLNKIKGGTERVTNNPFWPCPSGTMLTGRPGQPEICCL